MCVCVRERDRQTDRQRERETETETERQREREMFEFVVVLLDAWLKFVSFKKKNDNPYFNHCFYIVCFFTIFIV